MTNKTIIASLKVNGFVRTDNGMNSSFSTWQKDITIIEFNASDLAIKIAVPGAAPYTVHYIHGFCKNHPFLFAVLMDAWCVFEEDEEIVVTDILIETSNPLNFN
jgi:hypothetical protein